MKTIHAIFEKGMFRPTEVVDLPEGTAVRVVPELDGDSEPTVIQIEARQRVHESLLRSYDSGEPGNILETHNDHQP